MYIYYIYIHTFMYALMLRIKNVLRDRWTCSPECHFRCLDRIGKMGEFIKEKEDGGDEMIDLLKKPIYGTKMRVSCDDMTIR